MADLYNHQGKLIEAIDEIEKTFEINEALEARNELILAHVIRAIAYFKQHDVEGAREDLAAAERLTAEVPMFQPVVLRWQLELALAEKKLNRAGDIIDILDTFEADVLDDDAEPIARLKGYTR